MKITQKDLEGQARLDDMVDLLLGRYDGTKPLYQSSSERKVIGTLEIDLESRTTNYRREETK